MPATSDPPATTAIRETRRLGDAVFELALRRPPGFVFAAGQRLRVHWGRHERDYSIASGPGEEDLRVCVGRFAAGAVSPGLTALGAGDALRVSGPYGHFRWQNAAGPAVFVATGTGIAPFRSMAVDGRRPLLVLHGVRSAAGRYYRTDFEAAGIPYTACAGAFGEAAAGPLFGGRVTAFLDRRLPPGRYDFYLCGRREMVRDATLVIDERFSDSRIFSEIFY